MKKNLLMVLAIVAVISITSVATAAITTLDPPAAPVSHQIEQFGLSGADMKALEWDAYSGQEWVDNLVSEKVRRCRERMVIATLNTEGALSTGERTTVANMLSGTIVTSAGDIPADVQDYVIEHSRLPSAAERSQEAEILPK